MTEISMNDPPVFADGTVSPQTYGGRPYGVPTERSHTDTERPARVLPSDAGADDPAAAGVQAGAAEGVVADPAEAVPPAREGGLGVRGPVRFARSGAAPVPKWQRRHGLQSAGCSR